MSRLVLYIEIILYVAIEWVCPSRHTRPHIRRQCNLTLIQPR